MVVALTNPMQPKGYIKDMRRCDKELSKGWRQIATTLGPPKLQKIKMRKDL